MFNKLQKWFDGFYYKFIFRSISVERIAKKTVKKIAKSAFRVFKDEEIRRVLDFSKIEEIERDRIFNELVVTGLSLAILMAETISEINKERRNSFRKLQEEIFVYYPNWLKELGVEERYCDIWIKLIKMRCNEYRNDFKNYQNDFPDPQKANPWISVVAIGGLHHLRRGTTSPQDPLFKHLLAWLKFLANDIEKIFLKNSD